MTEAGWTSKKPTAAGFYWFKYDFTYIVEIVDVDGKLEVWFHGNEMQSPITYLDGEWLGPLSPDSYQQGRVAGLREAEEYAELCVEERQLQLLNLGDQAALDPNDRRPGWIRCKASEARRIQVWCTRQTQQAQEVGNEGTMGDETA